MAAIERQRSGQLVEQALIARGAQASPASFKKLLQQLGPKPVSAAKRG